MKIVLDTNILWVSISRHSKTHWIISELLKGTYILCVTTDILEEYEEIIVLVSEEVEEENIQGNDIKKIRLQNTNRSLLGNSCLVLHLLVESGLHFSFISYKFIW